MHPATPDGSQSDGNPVFFIALPHLLTTVNRFQQKAGFTNIGQNRIHYCTTMLKSETRSLDGSGGAVKCTEVDLNRPYRAALALNWELGSN